MILFINQHQNNSLLIFEPHSSNFIRINVTTLQLTRTEYSTCPGSQVDYIHYCTVLVYVFHYSTYCMFTLNRTGELSLQITSLGSRLGISESEATSIIVRQLLVYVYVLLFMPLCQEATSLHKSRPWWRSGLARPVTSPALFYPFILLCWIYLKLVPWILNTETKFGCNAEIPTVTLNTSVWTYWRVKTHY